MSESTRKQHQMPYTAKSQSDSRKFICKNCGRSMPFRRHNQVFCTNLCKNRYHSRGVRRISQLEKNQQKILDMMQSMHDINTALFNRIEALEDRPIPQAELGNGT